MPAKSSKNIESYKKLLPQKITVKVNKSDDGGLWANVKELPHCYSQARNFPELIEMLNDAIYTYLEIPTKFMKELGYYLPKEIVEEVKRQHYQHMVRKMIGAKPLKKKSEIFELSR